MSYHFVYYILAFLAIAYPLIFGAFYVLQNAFKRSILKPLDKITPLEVSLLIFDSFVFVLLVLSTICILIYGK